MCWGGCVKLSIWALSFCVSSLSLVRLCECGGSGARWPGLEHCPAPAAACLWGVPPRPLLCVPVWEVGLELSLLPSVL